jgi:hypothetical protein
MRYLRKALELVGCPDALLDPVLGAAATREAAAGGVNLPAAVVEWYCIPDDSDLWRWYASDHSPAIWRRDGAKRVVPEPAEGEYCEPWLHWWVNPAVCYDLTGWVNAPILPLMDETQGCWMWGVVLDGTPDPRVVISFGGGPWDTCADSFSSFVYALLFDWSPLGPAGVARRVHIEERVTDRHRRLLREEFRSEPTTRTVACAPMGFTERYSRPGQRVSYNQSDYSRFSHWELSATDPATLEDLVGRLGRIVPALNGRSPERFPEDGVDDRGEEIPF